MSITGENIEQQSVSTRSESDETCFSCDTAVTPSIPPESMLNESNYCLFLGDLSVFCSEEDLQKEFSIFGTILDIRIIRNKSTKKNLSYGFLEYDNLESATSAMEQMNGKIICGRAVKIRWASVNKAAEEQEKQPSSFCLLVADLPPFITQDHLYSVFTVYGYLQSIDIKLNKGGKKSGLLSAEVEYSDVNAAILAMRDLDGKIFMGQQLRISWAPTQAPTKQQTKKERNVYKAEDDNKRVSIFVSYEGIQTDTTITDERLRKVFSQYGELYDVAIRLSVQDKESNVQKGYAFICYQPNDNGIQAALQAAEAMNDRIAEDVHYHVEISRNLSNILDERSKPKQQGLTGLLPTIDTMRREQQHSTTLNNHELMMMMSRTTSYESLASPSWTSVQTTPTVSPTAIDSSRSYSSLTSSLSSSSRSSSSSTTSSYPPPAAFQGQQPVHLQRNHPQHPSTGTTPRYISPEVMMNHPGYPAAPAPLQVPSYHTGNNTTNNQEYLPLNRTNIPPPLNSLVGMSHPSSSNNNNPFNPGGGGLHTLQKQSPRYHPNTNTILYTKSSVVNTSPRVTMRPHTSPVSPIQQPQNHHQHQQHPGMSYPPSSVPTSSMPTTQSAGYSTTTQQSRQHPQMQQTQMQQSHPSQQGMYQNHNNTSYNHSSSSYNHSNNNSYNNSTSSREQQRGDGYYYPPPSSSSYAPQGIPVSPHQQHHQQQEGIMSSSSIEHYTVRPPSPPSPATSRQQQQQQMYEREEYRGGYPHTMHTSRIPSQQQLHHVPPEPRLEDHYATEQSVLPSSSYGMSHPTIRNSMSSGEQSRYDLYNNSNEYHQPSYSSSSSPPSYY